MAVLPFHQIRRQRAIGASLHDGEQIGVQQRQYHLGLGIPETAVVLDHFRARRGQHQAKIEASRKGTALRLHGADGGQEDFLHANVRDLVGVVGIGGNGAHAAGVQTGVIVADPLVIHGGNHGDHGLSVGEGENGHLRPGEELLNDDAGSALAESLVLHDGANGVDGLLTGHGDNHALAQCQTVRLDYGGDGAILHISECRLRVVKGFVGRGGNAVFLHQILGEDLASLNDGGVLFRAEGGNARLDESVGTSQHQRIVRGHHGKADALRGGKSHDLVDLLRTDLRYADRVGGHTAVARQGVDHADFGTFLQRFDQRVFAAAAANYDDISHSI